MLADMLAEHYPEDHELIIYEAATTLCEQNTKSVASRFTVRQANINFDPSCTLTWHASIPSGSFGKAGLTDASCYLDLQK